MTKTEFKEMRAKYQHGEEHPYAGPGAEDIHALIEYVGALQQRVAMLDDICGFCGRPGADKIPHPVRWPGEKSAGTCLVHAACEDAECGRAHAQLTDSQRADFLRRLDV